MGEKKFTKQELEEALLSAGVQPPPNQKTSDNRSICQFFVEDIDLRTIDLRFLFFSFLFFLLSLFELYLPFPSFSLSLQPI